MKKLKFKSNPLLNGYFFAILSVAGMLALRWLLNPILTTGAPLLSFIFPVIVVSLFFGMKQGVLATILGATAGVYFFIQPYFTFEIERHLDSMRILIFVVEGVSISALGEFHLRKKNKLQEALKTISLTTEKQQQADERARRLENDLARVWRLNTLGEMASGLAHELAQPISSIKNYSVAAQKMLEADDKSSKQLVVDSIKGIGFESDRASRFIHSLRAFIGTRKPQKQVEDINRLISDLDLLIKSELNANKIKIKYNFSEPTLEVGIDKIQIMHVVLNLLRNSIESMSTSLNTIKEIIVETRRDEDGALITVNDTGCGISPSDTEKVFEAFYSTKESGMGIGLAISRSMIDIHSGKIWNQPNEQMGTTFKVWLPMKESHA